MATETLSRLQDVLTAEALDALDGSTLLRISLLLRGESQRELAERLRVPPSSLHDYLLSRRRGKSIPDATAALLELEYGIPREAWSR